MPYYKTRVTPEKTNADIMLLLKKHGITKYEWTNIDGKESLKFVIECVVQGREITAGIRIDIPVIKALKRGRVVNVPVAQAYRLFFHCLKSILEATRFGIFKREELLFSFIMTQLPDGSTCVIKDRMDELLPKLLPVTAGKEER
jgi:hypothetical protein